MRVESDPGLLWFCLNSLFNWLRKLAPPSQPINCKTKTWSPAFSRPLSNLFFFTEFSLADDFVVLSSDWLVVMTLFFDTRMKNALRVITNQEQKILCRNFTCWYSLDFTKNTEYFVWIFVLTFLIVATKPFSFKLQTAW